MSLPHINPMLLQEWQKRGRLLLIWRCEKCYKKIPFYKSKSPIINAIHQMWAEDHKYCARCEAKLKKKKHLITPPKIPRINILLQKYEPESIVL